MLMETQIVVCLMAQAPLHSSFLLYGLLLYLANLHLVCLVFLGSLFLIGRFPPSTLFADQTNFGVSSYRLQVLTATALFILSFTLEGGEFKGEENF